MTTGWIPGPRQTVDRCRHPEFGEGVAVYGHGPAFFKADSGEVVSMKRIGRGGWSKDRGSWLSALQVDGQDVELDTTSRDNGVRWERAVGRQLGPGWLGMGGRKHPTITKWNPMFVRFEPDVGAPIEMWMEAIWAGLPKHDTLTRKLSAKAQKAIDEDRKGCSWRTIKTVDGEMFVYQPEEGYVHDAQPGRVALEVTEARQLGLPL